MVIRTTIICDSKGQHFYRAQIKSFVRNFLKSDILTPKLISEDALLKEVSPVREHVTRVATICAHFVHAHMSTYGTFMRKATRTRATTRRIKSTSDMRRHITQTHTHIHT